MPVSFQNYTAKLRPLIEDAFDRQLRVLLGEIVSGEEASLSANLKGGKKIRGCLTCMVTEVLEGSLESAIPRAVAIELIQTATLIHDDFVDQHRVRRNMPALWTLEGARRAVLLGDVMFASAIKMMNELSRDDGLTVAEAIAQISRGAYHEPLDPRTLIRDIGTNRLTSGSYDKIIHLKTGILFGAACRLGAIAAGADEKWRQKFLDYGSLIGEAYQIADDLKEVSRHVMIRFICSNEMAALTPAFLYFMEEMRPFILHALERDCIEVTSVLLDYFRASAELMEREVERRVQSAVSQIETVLSDSAYSELTRKAPWDLIEMFKRS
jgi:hypothetical protein